MITKTKRSKKSKPGRRSWKKQSAAEEIHADSHRRCCSKVPKTSRSRSDWWTILVAGATCFCSRISCCCCCCCYDPLWGTILSNLISVVLLLLLRDHQSDLVIAYQCHQQSWSQDGKHSMITKSYNIFPLAVTSASGLLISYRCNTFKYRTVLLCLVFFFFALVLLENTNYGN